MSVRATSPARELVARLAAEVASFDARRGPPAPLAPPTSPPPVFRRPVIWGYGRPYYVGEDFIEVPVESWVYNLGPNKLMRRFVSKAA